MLKSKVKKLLVALSMACLLTGCQGQNSITKKEITQNYNQSTKILLQARGVVAKQLTTKQQRKKIVLKADQVKQLKKIREQLKQAQIKIKKSDKGAANYPKSMDQYQALIDSYIVKIQKKKTKLDINNEFHQAAGKAQDINTKYQGGKKNKYLQLVNMADNDTQKSIYKEYLKYTKAKRPSKGDIPVKRVDLSPNNKKYVISIPTIWGIAFIIISVLIISVIYLQPNKSNDSMSALTTTGGAELYNRPKPRGYQLFLVRTTKILILILSIMLILFNNWKG